MKKLILISTTIVIFGLLASYAMSAAFLTENPVNPVTPIARSDEYLPSSVNGYVRVVPPDGNPYIIRESELPELKQNSISFVCAEILPTSLTDYYRVLSADGDVVVVHASDLEAYCGAGNSSHKPVIAPVPMSEVIFCDKIDLLIPTNNENYYRILYEDGSLDLVHKNELSHFCELSISSAGTTNIAI